jgi:prophage regulatory protein
MKATSKHKPTAREKAQALLAKKPQVIASQEPAIVPAAISTQSIVSNDDCFMKRTAVQAMTGVSKSTLYGRMGRGTFPKSRDIGSGRRWLRSEIVAWMNQAPVTMLITELQPGVKRGRGRPPKSAYVIAAQAPA